MAMQSGAVVVPEKIPVQWYSHGHQQQPPHYHQVDERDGFVYWLRGEFAAANAIIDALCHHLRAVGEPGEYDSVIGSIQNRRCNWNPILHMQQYYPVADVVYALQQVGWRRQQKMTGFEGGLRFRRGGRGQRGGYEMLNAGGEMNGKDLNNGDLKSSFNGDIPKMDKKEDKDVTELNDKSESNNSVTRQGSTEGAVGLTDAKAEDTVANGSGLVEKSNVEVSPKAFVASETCDGKTVNIAEGLKLYEDLVDDSEISKLTTLVSDLRAAGRRGHLPGQTFVVSRRPMKGHGREMIQLGVPIADAPSEDEANAGASRGTPWSNNPKLEPIPVVLQNVIDRLLTEQVVSIKPDTAFIDIFNEGDHSQPHIWPQWFGRPVCVMFLTECEMIFGKSISVEHPGDYRGALKLSLSPGSLLVMQGRSADLARHAIPAIRKQRILVTLVKSQPKKFNWSPPPSNWAPPPSRSPSHIRPGPAKHYGPVPTNGVLPAPTARPQLPPPNGIQSIYVPTPVAAGIAFSAPVALPPTSIWPSAPLRHPPPRLPLPGTGVFLPPQGSNNSSNQPVSTMGTENVTTGIDEHGAVKSNGVSKKADDGGTEQECNGGVEKKDEESVSKKEDEKDDAVKSGEAV